MQNTIEADGASRPRTLLGSDNPTPSGVRGRALGLNANSTLRLGAQARGPLAPARVLFAQRKAATTETN